MGSTAIEKPTLKELRAEARRLGVTAESAGRPIEDLLRLAQENEDPFGFVAIHAPGETLAEEPRQSEVAAIQADSARLAAVRNSAPDEAAAIAANVPTREIAVPISPDTFSGKYISRRVDVHMTIRQSFCLRRLHRGLIDKGEELANGRRVVSPADAVRWLLEKLG